MDKNGSKTPPTFLRLTALRFPITAIVSILHRISGAVLFLGIPYVLYLYGLSGDGYYGFETARDVVHSVPGILAVLALLAAFCYHLCAGVRHLIMDTGRGLTLSVARRTAWLVLVVAAAIFVITVGWLLL